MNPKEVNILVLAFLGDTIYENYIRRFLVMKKISNVKDLQKESIKYVSGMNQAKLLTKLVDNNFFNEEELDVIKRARNYKNGSHPKNCDVISYKYATALEALLGYLSLNNDYNRIYEIMNEIVGEKL